MATPYQDNRGTTVYRICAIHWKFIKNFSEIATPLTDLIRGAQMFKWTRSGYVR